ncbi:uncharacterized protein LOC133346469 isoform X3 [Lethenteron reissneri]|uniref:uncharacterized protein LOC133346469 isoform X3 n=1 Tax=Lethenteron reissneri TaxID=7753 RepID=UPI002AB5E855|nr:uncharacterized protein LOC133346469 isoform X3 [Lethenteron reissneri]
MECEVATPVLEPSGDFPAWLEAQGVNAEVARAIDSELGIRDYGVLCACVGDGLVRAELLATARDRLPFGYYAVLRHVVKGLQSSEPHNETRWDTAASPGDVSLGGLVDVLFALFRGLSRELLLSVQRLGGDGGGWDGGGCGDDFQSQVLLKLDTIIENQMEQLCLLQTLANRSVVNEGLDDVLPNPINDTDELEELCCRINTDENLKMEMLKCTSQISYLSSLGGCNVRDSVRRMMKRLGTNALWSNYSLRGRKGKTPLIDLPVFMVLTRACLKSYPRAKVKEIEVEIAETLKHSPNKRGGANYKEPEVITMKNENQPSHPVSSSDIVETHGSCSLKWQSIQP